MFYFLGDLLSRRHVALSSKPTVHILIYFALTDVLQSCVVVVGRGGETVRERERERDRWLWPIVIRPRHCDGLVLEEYGLQTAQDRTASGRGHRGRYRGFALDRRCDLGCLELERTRTRSYVMGQKSECVSVITACLGLFTETPLLCDFL